MTEAEDKTNLPAKLPIIDIATLNDDDVVPPRRWVFHSRVPAACVVVLSGPGGAGKTTLGLQACVGTGLATEWCGSPAGEPPGPAIYFSTEEPVTELRRRLYRILEQLKVPLHDLAGALYFASTVPDEGDSDAEIINPVLGAPDRHGIIKATPLLHEFLEGAKQIKPRLIVIESAADVFAGNENDRQQTAQFIGLLRVLALRTGAAVMLISHPSLSGIASGTGLAGSTQWINGPRARLYLSEIRKNGDDETDTGFRDLKVIKSNYGPSGEVVRLRWHDGVFIIEPKTGSLERIAADANADTAFMRLLERYTAQGRHVSATPTSPTYAPATFAKEGVGFNKVQLGDAMRRLFSTNKIRVETYGRPSRPYQHIVAC